MFKWENEVRIFVRFSRAHEILAIGKKFVIMRGVMAA